MNNKLTDLNNHMFAQLERLNDESIKGDQLATEIERSKAVTTVSRGVNAIMNKKRYSSLPEEIKPSVKTLAKLQHRLHELTL